MSGRLRVLASAVLLLSLCSSLHGQTVKTGSSSIDELRPRRVIASASGSSIRFSSLGELLQMRIEVVDSSGETIFDSGFKQGNVIDWPGPDIKRTRPNDEAYLCIVTVKDSSNQLTRKQAIAVLRDASVRLTRFDASALSTAQAQVIGVPTDEDASVIIVESNDFLATAVLAHDGNSTQLVSGSNGFSIGSGNFFANKVFEHIRITAEGNVGIGVSSPQAKLDVAGLIRASKGIVFPDGSIQYSAASKTYGDKSSRPGSFSQSTPSKPGASGEQHIDAAGTGTLNFLAKWSETGGAGTLTNSGIFEAVSGNIGIGTNNPQTGLDYHNVQAPFFARDFATNPGNAVGALQLGLSGAGSRFAGIGPSFLFFSENTAGTRSFLGRVSAIWENATAGAEAGSIFFQVRANSADGNALTERMRITAAGNVGIGTSSPGARLDVAGSINTSSQFNIGGLRVLSTPGTKNTFVGGSAGPGGAPTGCCNSFFGALTGIANTTGTRNSFFGDEVGGVNVDGTDNSFFGTSVGTHNTSGSFNSFFGNFSGNDNQTGNSNSFFGSRAGISSTGSNNAFFGSNAGDTNVTGGELTIIGSNADVGSNNLSNATAVGARARVGQSNSLVLGSIGGVNGATADTSVGIGTITPASKLEVFNGVVTSSGPSGGRFLSRNPNNQSALVQLDWFNDGTFDFPRIRYGGINQGATNGFLIQGPGDVTKVAILNDGNVGIGTGAPVNKLHVVADVIDSNGNATPVEHVVQIANSHDGRGKGVLALSMNSDGADPIETDNYITFFVGSSTSIGSIEGNSQGGVVFAGPGNDYAEWLPRLNPDERIQPGEVVGVIGGHITKDTRGAAKVMAVSTAPIVLGNDPGREARAQYAQVAFIGQVMVQVRGAVRAGDFIIASGLNDGAGVAVSPECITPEQFEQVVGQAWESSSNARVKAVRTAIGSIQSDPTVSRLLESNRRQAAQLVSMDARLTALELKMKTKPASRSRHVVKPR